MDANRQYNEAPKTPNMGGPHHWAAAAVLQWMANHNSFRQRAEREKIIQGSQVTNGADIAEIIPHCRVKTQRDNGKGLLEVAFLPERRATQDTLKHILLNEGGILSNNTAPRGPLARTVVE